MELRRWMRFLAITMLIICLPLATSMSIKYKMASLLSDPMAKYNSTLKFGSQEGVDSHLTCAACTAAIGLIRELLKWGVSHATIANRLLSVCKVFHIEDGIVCRGMIAAFSDEFFAAVQGSKLTSSEICLLMVQDVCTDDAYDPDLRWTVKLPNTTKPPPTRPVPVKGSPKLKILQLSDIHLDRLYTAGSNANCDKPLCCQNISGSTTISKERAGYWGTLSYPCDIPERTLDNLFSHLASTEQVDMIYWTGDLPSHDVWRQSREMQLELIELLTNKLLHYFPNTPIYPALGNHESYPVDSFPPPFVTGNESASWLYNMLAKTWSRWLPESTLNTIRYGAYYTVLVKPKFRIVSINTNYCEHRNFWLALNVTDPAFELNWLIQVLQAAEDKQEKVHLLGHIPPGVEDCLRVWSDNIGKVIVRYSNTITGYFLGHTHYDHFKLFYDPSTSEPVTVGYIAPSVTTYTGFKGANPGYRVYTVDGFHDNTTMTVLDHDTVILNMSRANTDNVTVWEREYSAMAEYNMTDLSPSSWHSFSTKLLTDDKLFNSFHSNYYKQSPPGVCNSTCRSSLICNLHVTTYGKRKYCGKLSTSYEELNAYELAQPKSC